MVMHRLLYFWLLRLAVLTPLFLALPGWAQQPQVTPPTDTDWNNLQRLPLAALLLVERTDGTRIKGRFVSLAEDALSVRYGREDYDVMGVARARVQRVWLFGERKTAQGALAGVVVGAALGALLGAGLCDDDGGGCIAFYTPVFGGMFAGIGAAVGATVRERTLIYRAPPPGTSPSAATLPVAAPHLSRPPAVDLLPAPLRDVYQVFSTEQAARELSRELVRTNQPPDTAPQLTPKN